MTAHHRLTEAQIDPARALMIRAMCALISATLDPGTARTTLAAGQLLGQIELAYPGSVQNYDQSLTLHLFTVRATAHANTIALLRNWQQAARLRLETGVR